MVSGENDESGAVLTPPLSLERGPDDEYRAPNLLQRILSLFKNVRPGSDLTRFQLPPLFNIPKSQLQCFGESVYCTSDDMLERCANGKSPLERFTSVVALNLSTLRPVMFGMAPFNPILGETHHVSRGTLNVLLEQVSHHPPVTALHATDEKENVEMVWCQHPIPRFHGTSIEAEVLGQRQLKLLNHGENYIMNSPKLFIRFLPIPGVDWVGDVRIHCEESGLEAELSYRGSSFLGFRGGNRYVKGKIFDYSSSKIIYEIDGHWDSTVTIKDVDTGKITTIYDAKETLSDLKTPIVKNPMEVWSSESAVVWSEVFRSILNKDWEKAKGAKRDTEEKERGLFTHKATNLDPFLMVLLILDILYLVRLHWRPLRSTKKGILLNKSRAFPLGFKMALKRFLAVLLLGRYEELGWFLVLSLLTTNHQMICFLLNGYLLGGFTGIGAYFGVQCEKRGLLVRIAGDSIFMSPPLIISPDEVDEIISIYGEALKATEARVMELKSKRNQ